MSLRLPEQSFHNERGVIAESYHRAANSGRAAGGKRGVSTAGSFGRKHAPGGFAEFTKSLTGSPDAIQAVKNMRDGPRNRDPL
jgi:hypothetical protein